MSVFSGNLRCGHSMGVGVGITKSQEVVYQIHLN